MIDEEKENQKIELKPHLFKVYLKAIGFKLLYVINESSSNNAFLSDIADIDIST